MTTGSALSGSSADVEPGAPRQRHAERLEVVRRHEHRGRAHLRSARGLKRDFALRADPADQCYAGIGVAKIHVVRIGPLLGLLMRAHGRRDELDQLLGVHARRRQRRQARDVRNGNDRRHADSQRHHTHKRERSAFASDRLAYTRSRQMREHIYD